MRYYYREFWEWVANRLDGIGWQCHRLAAWFDELSIKALPKKRN